MRTKQPPPFGLQGTRDSIAILASGVTGYAVERLSGSASEVWFRSHEGQSVCIRVDQRDALPMFEVFALHIATLSELQDKWREWTAPALPDDLPDTLRALMSRKPPMPVSPTNFDAWPFQTWRTEVLRRAEFIIADVGDVGTFGEHPNMQSAMKPTEVPAEASATCEVAVGLLFSAPDGERLLIGVAWMPFNLTVTDQRDVIDQYLASCETTDLNTYLQSALGDGCR